MISTKKLSLISLLLLFAALSIWLLQTYKAPNPAKHSVKSLVPDSYMYHVTAKRIDKEGKIIDILTAPQAIAYQKQNTMILTNPKLVAFTKVGSPWHIQSQFARITNSKQIYLWGQVTMSRKKSTKNLGVTFVTQHIYYNTNSNIAHTLAPITIREDSGSLVKAIGLKANFVNNTMNLLSQVRGLYVPQQKQT